MTDYTEALAASARAMQKRLERAGQEIIRVKVGPDRSDYPDPDPAEILAKLAEHRAYYEDYYNGLVEHDADYIKQREAQAHLNGIEECVNIVRRVIDGD